MQIDIVLITAYLNGQISVENFKRKCVYHHLLLLLLFERVTNRKFPQKIFLNLFVNNRVRRYYNSGIQIVYDILFLLEKPVYYLRKIVTGNQTQILLKKEGIHGFCSHAESLGWLFFDLGVVIYVLHFLPCVFKLKNNILYLIYNI